MPLSDEDRKAIRDAGFSTAYYDLVDDPDDWPGMIAYCQYKEDIIERSRDDLGPDKESVRQRLLLHKKLTSGQIQMLKEIAGFRVKAYAQNAVDSAKPSIERDALSNRIDELGRTVGGLVTRFRSRWLRRVVEAGSLSLVTGVVASLATYVLILAAPEISGWVAARDTGAGIRRLELQLASLEGELGRLPPYPRKAQPAVGSPDELGRPQDAAGLDLGSAIPDQYQPERIPALGNGELDAIWSKAALHDEDTDGFRKDICGAWIRSNGYGDVNGAFGWVAGALLPNFPNPTERWQPFHWQNAPATDGTWVCRITAEGVYNVLIVPEYAVDQRPPP